MEKVLDFDRFLNEKEGSGFFAKLKNKFKKEKDPKPEEIKKEDDAESVKKKMEDECKGSKYKAFGEAKSPDMGQAIESARGASFINLKSKLEKDGKSLSGEANSTTLRDTRLFKMNSDGSYVAYAIAGVKEDSYDELPKKDEADEDEEKLYKIEASKVIAKKKEEIKKVEALKDKGDKKEDKKGILTFTSKDPDKDAVKKYKERLSEIGMIDKDDLKNSDYGDNTRKSTLNAMRYLELFTGKSYKESDDELFKSFQNDVARFLEKKEDIKKIFK